LLEPGVAVSESDSRQFPERLIEPGVAVSESG
jgi:hypothetical protein